MLDIKQIIVRLYLSVFYIIFIILGKATVQLSGERSENKIKTNRPYWVERNRNIILSEFESKKRYTSNSSILWYNRIFHLSGKLEWKS